MKVLYLNTTGRLGDNTTINKSSSFGGYGNSCWAPGKKNANENNNTRASAAPILVTLSAAPDLVVGSITDSVRHLPSTIASAAGKGAELIESAAHAVGKVANEAGKGLFAGLGAPVLIGAGLIGLFLVSRNRGHHEEA